MRFTNPRKENLKFICTGKFYYLGLPSKSKETMRTFKDLVFETYADGRGKRARLLFDNGYGVSVVREKIPAEIWTPLSRDYYTYTNDESQWEVAVLEGDDEEWDLCYTTHITEDVLGWQTEEDVTHVMRKIQEL